MQSDFQTEAKILQNIIFLNITTKPQMEIKFAILNKDWCCQKN